MIINEEDKTKYLDNTLGKFFTNAIKYISEEDYDTVFNSYEFIKTYDNIIITVDTPLPKMVDTLYYLSEKDLPNEITEEIYVNYIAKQCVVYQRPLWINQCKCGFELSTTKTKHSIREVNSYEYNEICQLLEKYKEKVIKRAKKKFKYNKATITAFPIW